jgi:hypothetical protein
MAPSNLWTFHLAPEDYRWRKMDICLPDLYHHRPPKPETSYHLLHGKASKL